MIDGTYIGVLDRIVDGKTAVILLEADDEVQDQRDIPIERVPQEGRKEGSVLAVTVEGSQIEAIEYRPEETTQRREDAQNRLDRLGKRLSEKPDEDE
ncbi:hypothetical protein AArcSl_2307 [Halalkaliarchaeum desulfuricum]|uniref:DUF3006 domain-containing protein n=1 Tax=Halalkaliarchaeum desulfuricum TaxID=2055893 RepID=A0A343TLF8_9EURY|nr:DUF3006 domain-containing protein [Halalkaliarchaeum desulfuricum]AUX09930.1 hypothetical protein AArcSl_2307 [Halalkaliarchaeum desulfuricum]